MQRDGFAEEGTVTVRLRAQSFIEAAHGLVVLAGMQQAQSASREGLPKFGIAAGRGFEFRRGFAELALTLQRQTQVVACRGMFHIQGGDLGVGCRRVFPAVLFEAYVTQGGVNLGRIFAALGGRLQGLRGLIQLAFGG